MKSLTTIFLLIFIVALTGCNFPTPTSVYKGTLHLEHVITQRETVVPSTPQEIPTSEPSPFFTVVPTVNLPTPTSTPDPFENLYNCQMGVKFLSGPLKNKGTEFQVLGRDYFWDKGDKFEMGKGTGIYYESERYFILHSSYLNGNIFREMEAEFLRRYLENWGWADPSTIQENLSQLIGSEGLWRCGNQNLFSTRVNGIIRLSHEASNRLWLEPRNIDEILRSREGLPSEWIGDLPLENERDLIIGFCGWGPFSLGEARFTYFRYLISFEVLEHYR